MISNLDNIINIDLHIDTVRKFTAAPAPDPKDYGNRFSHIIITYFYLVFGVKRGKCQKTGCSCPQYRPPSDQPDPTQGGKCNDCGHYPTKHADMGKLPQASAGSLMTIIPPNEIHRSYKIGQGIHLVVFLVSLCRLFIFLETYLLGAFGTVYRAELWGQVVAVKELLTDQLTPAVVKEFHDEAEILKCVVANLSSIVGTNLIIPLYSSPSPLPQHIATSQCWYGL